MNKLFIKLLSAILVIFLIVPTAVFASGSTAEAGDSDRDGEITDWDAVMLARWLAGWSVSVDESVCDLDGDKKISENDYVIISRYLAGWYGTPDEVIKNTVHVDPETGNDTGADGSAEKPFATIDGAKGKVRELLSGGAKGEITVYLHEGEYPTKNGFVFEEADGGSDKCTVVYKAYNDDEVTVTGKKTLKRSDFVKADDSVTQRIRKEEARDNIYVLDLRSAGVQIVSNSDEYFKFYYSDTMMEKARYPDRNFDDLTSIYRSFIRPESVSGCFYGKDLPVESWESTSGIEVRGFIYYDYFIERLGYLGYEKGTYDIFGEPTEAYKINVSGGTPNNNLNYYFHNVFEELDFRGEYYIDEANQLLYVYAADDFDDIEITYSYNTSALVRLNGADHITFDGIIFEGGKNFGIVTETTSSYITVRNCTVREISNNAIKLIGQNNTVDHCHIYNAGGYGVQLDDIMSGGSLVSSYSKITNNEIDHIALVNMVYNPAAYANGNGTVIAHNYIHDISHCVVQANAPDVIIEYNHFEGCCYQGGDAGVIYTGGFDPMYIRYNFFDYCINKQGGGGPRDVYIDGGGGCKEIIGNIVVGNTGYGLYAGAGHGNILQNNIVVGSFAKYEDYCNYDMGDYQLVRYPDGYCWTQLWGNFGEDDLLWGIRHPYSFTQVKATNVKDLNEKYRAGVCGGGVYSNNVNVYENPNMPGGVAYVGPWTPEVVGPGIYLNGTVSDNMIYYTVDEVGFVDAEKGDFNLREDSKIFSDIPGFRAIPFDEIGIQDN